MNTTHSTDQFDQVANVFADYGVSVRGYIRYKVVQKNLEPYIANANKKLKVLDIGGGSGPDAAWLASLGHTVTLIEPSAKQREFAQRRFNYFLSKANRNRIHVVDCGLDALGATPKYDVVLVHGVAMYQSQPADFVVDAAAHAKKGGLISVVEKNYYGSLARAVRRLDFGNLQTLKHAKRSLNLIGQEVYAFTPEELENIIAEQANAEVLEWSGIRVMSDEVTEKVSTIDSSELAQILEVEIEQSHSPSIRGIGQMLHFIARKR